MADKLAEQTNNIQSYTGPKPTLRLTMMNVGGVMRQWLVHEHDEMWHDTEGCHRSKLLIPGFD